MGHRHGTDLETGLVYSARKSRGAISVRLQSGKPYEPSVSVRLLAFGEAKYRSPAQV
jgi:hypothetical protein